jgi:hypothetical protein
MIADPYAFGKCINSFVKNENIVQVLLRTTCREDNKDV